MEIPFLKLVLALMTFCVVVLGVLVNLLEPYLPAFISQTLRYGKFAYKGPAAKSSLHPIEVPKRWFKHFYVFAALYASYITYLAFSIYCGRSTVPASFQTFLNFLFTSERHATVSSGNVLVALLLLSIQCWRRLYETYCVSVFSEARMNITHYLAGFVHYFAAATAIVSEAPYFAVAEEGKPAPGTGDGMSVAAVVAVGVFLWAFVHQYRAAVILASLRKNKQGSVVSTKHSVPSGDWFEWVSSPHLLAEILMYLSLSVLLWPTSAWHYVIIWVVSNQVETALLSHWWYQETFKDYPKGRRALIPFVF